MHRRKDGGDGGEKKVIENNSMVKAFNKALVGKGASRRLHQRCVGRFVFIVSDSAKNINDSITFIRENVRMQHQTTKNRPHRVSIQA